MFFYVFLLEATKTELNATTLRLGVGEVSMVTWNMDWTAIISERSRGRSLAELALL